ncbi:MAG: hypothetical protein J5965_26925 [Aeriscardovia sp.]|nr:hypothetical protein [Aeriscardovia sp.]
MQKASCPARLRPAKGAADGLDRKRPTPLTLNDAGLTFHSVDFNPSSTDNRSGSASTDACCSIRAEAGLKPASPLRSRP